MQEAFRKELKVGDWRGNYTGTQKLYLRRLFEKRMKNSRGKRTSGKGRGYADI